MHVMLTNTIKATDGAAHMQRSGRCSIPPELRTGLCPVAPLAALDGLEDDE